MSQDALCSLHPSGLEHRLALRQSTLMATIDDVWLIFSLLGRTEKDKNVTPLCTQVEIKQGGKHS